MKLGIRIFGLLGVIFGLACNTYEPPTVLEYSIDLSVPTTNPIVFKNYVFTVHAADNKFSGIKVYTNPAGFIDSSHMNAALMNVASKKDMTVSGYFLKPGTCKFYIEGLAADQRTFKDSITFTIRSPFQISGKTLSAIGETDTFKILPSDTLALSGLKLKINWIVNNGTPSPLRPDSIFQYTPLFSGTQKVTAIIVDSANDHSLAVDTLEFSVPGHRPVIDSVKLLNASMNAGDSLRLNLSISDKDTTSLIVVLTGTKHDSTRVDTILIPSSQSYNSLLTVNRPFIDTGSYVLTIQVIDPSGLVSATVTKTIAITANPPTVTFVPDSSVMYIPSNYPYLLSVTKTAKNYRWRGDNFDTTTLDPSLTRIFFNSTDTVTIIVNGIDQYGYSGKPDTVRLLKSTTFYQLSFSHIPGDSVYRDSAYWEVKTPDTGIVRANAAKFYWSLIREPTGDIIYRDSSANIGDSLSRFSLKGLAIPEVNLDSIDLSVSVVLKEARDSSQTSAILRSESKIRLFRPTVRLTSILPDSVSTEKPVSIKFKISDVENGVITSVFWQYADSASPHQLMLNDTMLTFVWKTPGTRTLCIWAFDNDGQRSDTLKPIVNVIKNQPRITGISWLPTSIYSKDPCTLSVSVQPGISGARIDSVRWLCPTSSTMPTSGVTRGLTFPASFATPGWQKVTVTVYDSLHDSASRLDSVLIASGNPSVELRSILPNGDSISAKATAIFKYAVSTARNGTIDSVFWRQQGLSSIHGLKVAGNDSSFSNVWIDTGSVTLQLWARDNLKNASDTLTKTIRIVKSQPRIIGFSFKPAKVYTNELCSLSITAARGYSRAKIDSIHWSCPTWTGPATRKTTTDATIAAVFATPGKHMVTVMLYDSLLDSGSRIDSINIISGNPLLSIPQILPRNDSISTKVPAIFKYAVSTARAGFVDSVFWQQAGSSVITGLKVSGSDSTFKITWPDSGHVAIKIWARDNVDNQSDTITRSFVIVKNKPVVSAFIVPSGTPPIKRSYNYSIVPRRGFSGSRIIKYHWVYPTGSGIKDSMRTDSTLSLQFDTPGTKIISVYVQDSLNDTSALFIDTVTIDQGLPVVTSLTIDSSASGGSAIFVNDAIKVTIHAKDTNGTIATYRAVLRNNANGDSIVALGPDTTLSLIVATGYDGGYSLKVYASDNDGLQSAAYPATPKALTIRSGKPVVTAFIAPFPVWIFDTLTYQYSAKDTNGGLSQIIFNWGDGSKIDTAVVSPKDTVLNRGIAHWFTNSGNFSVTISALDNDNQQGPSSTFVVTVKKGVPIVRSTMDTVVTWLPYTTVATPADSIHFVAQASDSNGTIKRKYIWYLTPPFDAVSPDTVITDTNVLDIGLASNVWADRGGGFTMDTTHMALVKVEDDDGFTAIDTFYFYYVGKAYLGNMGIKTNARCKYGYPDISPTERDTNWFEFTNYSDVGRDSLQFDSYAIFPSGGQFYTFSLKVIITAGKDFSGTVMQSFSDTLTVFNKVPLTTFMKYIGTYQWQGLWRPPLTFFSAYEGKGFNEVDFDIIATVYNRIGIAYNWYTHGFKIKTSF